MRTALLLVLTLLVASLPASAAQKPCPAWLGTRARARLEAPATPAELAAIREELLQASLRDQGAPGREGAFYSNIRAGETPELARAWDTRVAAGAHVLSLGSGPDVYRLLHAFPLASDYHLVELGAGWGSGPGEILAEVETRLRAIAPDAQVTRVREGFLRYRPAPALHGSVRIGGKDEQVRGPWRPFLRAKGQVEWKFYLKPVTWEVRWLSPALGPQVRRFHWHAVDFTSADVLRASVLGRIPEGERVAGLLVTGIGVPGGEALDALARAMVPGGLYIAEMDYFNNRGETSSPDDPERHREMDAYFETADTIAPDLERRAREPWYLPTTYLFRRR